MTNPFGVHRWPDGCFDDFNARQEAARREYAAHPIASHAETDDEQRAEIRARRAAGEPAATIAPDYGLHETTVYRIAGRQK